MAAIRTSSAAAPELADPAGLDRFAFRAMGTDVLVLVPPGATRAAADVQALFEAWEGALTRFRPDSELSRLNAAAGTEVRVGPLLWAAVDAARRAAFATDGLFDPTMLGQLRALGYDRTFTDVAGDGPPGPGVALPGGAWRSMTMDAVRSTVRLPAGAGLDLGGIAKGMAVDAAIDELRARGAAPGAVDAGGDLAVVGLPPGRADWPIRVETLDGGEVVGLAEGALATSSTLRRRWRRGGVERHHLLDPRTGRPATSDLVSATIAARRCEQAEVAAKVALLLGSEDAARFMAARRLSGLLVRHDGERVRVGTWSAEHGEPMAVAGPAR